MKEHLLTCSLSCPPSAGTLGYNQSSFHMEMSQIGFSTHTLDVGPSVCDRPHVFFFSPKGVSPASPSAPSGWRPLRDGGRLRLGWRGAEGRNLRAHRSLQRGF